ncbi:hypothetical protein L1987_64080 [Smallanthus sonchifolius]|uniref:Uncharacterized protein n=1 Tax=Smallanthus sonchifolius TaxID=185202 RepID=A0ACB9CF45_9ASTR|nr:hypothetical protein L1987_64080 [Smallanthus sonchifolius]
MHTYPPPSNNTTSGDGGGPHFSVMKKAKSQAKSTSFVSEHDIAVDEILIANSGYDDSHDTTEGSNSIQGISSDLKDSKENDGGFQVLGNKNRVVKNVSSNHAGISGSSAFGQQLGVTSNASVRCPKAGYNHPNNGRTSVFNMLQGNVVAMSSTTTHSSGQHDVKHNFCAEIQGHIDIDDSRKCLKQVLLYEISAFNDYIKENVPFISSHDISTADLLLGSSFYQLEIAWVYCCVESENRSIDSSLQWSSNITSFSVIYCSIKIIVAYYNSVFLFTPQKQLSHHYQIIRLLLDFFISLVLLGIASMTSSSDSSADESGYVIARPPCPRAAYVTGPDRTRTIDLNLRDHPGEHVLGKCPMWLPAESSGTKSDARSSSATQKDLKSNATSPRCQNTVSAPMRLERPKARTRENTRKRTHLSKKVTFKNIETGEPSTKAPQVVTPQESTKEYVQLYRYFDWKDEVNQSLRWLTSSGTDMKARLDFHTDLATDMSG